MTMTHNLEANVNDALRLVLAAGSILQSRVQLSGNHADPLDQIETLIAKSAEELQAAIAAIVARPQ